MAFFQAGTVRLYLGIPEGDDHRSGPLAYFRVSDVERECRRLQDGGVELLTDPHLVHRDESYELWMASFHDSEGNTLVVMEEQALG